MDFQRVFLFLLLFISGVCFPQGEANFWYFGQNAGLNFNSGSPVVINDGALVTEEGCSVISNPFGELLFYTDGRTIYDRNHQIMPNGTGLLGHLSSTQSSIIIPKPGSSSIYYVFTVPYFGTGSLSYSEVDLDMNGGFGDVNEVKNVILGGNICEKLTAVRNAQGNGFWIITHGVTGLTSDTGDSFFSYSITAEGVNPNPVVSKVGVEVEGLLYRTMGYLKVSPSGKKIIAANFGLVTESFDFNRQTGKLTNPKIISYNHSSYGVEFSLSGDVVYLTTGQAGDRDELHQYDLTANDIPSTKKILYSDVGGVEMAALQMAPDFKIYVAMTGTNFLSVINNPDVLGDGCNFVKNEIDMSPGIVESGLPQFNQSYFYGAIQANNLCLGSTTSFSFLSDIVANSIHWDFGDGNSSTSLTPTHVYESPGDYTVVVSAVSDDGTISKSKEITIYEPPIIVDDNLEVVLCRDKEDAIDLKEYDYFYLNQQSSPSYGVSYHYSYEEAIDNIQPIKTDFSLEFGISNIYVRVFHLENEECAVISNFKIKMYQIPSPTLLDDIFICDNKTNTGVGVIDLSYNNSFAVYQNSNLFGVSYHLSEVEADLGENDLDEFFLSSSNPRQIFARIYNLQHEECYVTTSFNIGFHKMPIAHQPPAFFGCYDHNGVEFELNLQIPFVLDNQSATDFEVTFYGSMEDAVSDNNELPLLYVTHSLFEVVYARITNRLSKDCFDITNFEIFSREKPILKMDEVYVICEGSTSVRIALPDGFTSYLWSNGDQSNVTEINSIGAHYVTITQDYGDVVCTKTINFMVRNSEPAIIKDVEINDWKGGQNSLSITVEGIGEYIYSLDGINFQENPYFGNLSPGEYTVYVKDFYGCGTVKRIVFLLDYPRYFTPNNDGFNDFWRIKFSSQAEPDLTVLIFDRYGRFLKKLFGDEVGWDGTFDGKNLPSDDYWFIVNREDGTKFRGHFTLKR